MLCVACISYIILLLVHLGLSVHLPPPLLGPALEVVEVTTVEGRFSSQMYDAVAHGIEEVPVMGHDHQRRCTTSVVVLPLRAQGTAPDRALYFNSFSGD